jgi:hypothetical protein
MVVLFAGFKMGMFFNRALDSGCGGYGYGSGSGYSKMMNRDFEGGYYGNQMILRGRVGEVSTSTAQ